MKASGAGVFLCIALVACMATPSEELSFTPASAERLGVGGVSLGDHWTRVLPQATERFGVEPVCTARKIAKRNSRRAYLLEACRYTPLDDSLDGTPVTDVVYHFIDQSLLRIDVLTAELDTVASNALQSRLMARFGAAESGKTVSGGSETVSDGSDRVATASDGMLALWRSGTDELILRRTGESGTLRLLLHLQDTDAAKQAAALDAR